MIWIYTLGFVWTVYGALLRRFHLTKILSDIDYIFMTLIDSLICE